MRSLVHELHFWNMFSASHSSFRDFINYFGLLKLVINFKKVIRLNRSWGDIVSVPWFSLLNISWPSHSFIYLNVSRGKDAVDSIFLQLHAASQCELKSLWPDKNTSGYKVPVSILPSTSLSATFTFNFR